MRVLVPDDLTALEQRLDAAEWDRIETALTSGVVDLSLPKWDIATSRAAPFSLRSVGLCARHGRGREQLIDDLMPLRVNREMPGLRKGMKTGSRYDIGKPTANERRAHAVVVPCQIDTGQVTSKAWNPHGPAQGAGVAGDAVGSPLPLADLRLEVRSPHRVFVDRVVSSDRTAECSDEDSRASVLIGSISRPAAHDDRDVHELSFPPSGSFGNKHGAKDVVGVRLRHAAL